MSYNKILSESEEMYLVTIRKICESCEDTPIPIPDLAEALDVLPVSVNHMVKKLTEAGLVIYTPYKGVELTSEGRNISTKILRHRRLWEVFLVKDLKMTLEEVDLLSCRLEHITTSRVALKLSEFLGNPTVCFHGSPIYRGDDTQQNSTAPLNQMKAGQNCHIHHIEADENIRSFLSEEGLNAGWRTEILAVGGSGTILVESSTGKQISIAPKIAEKIFVEVILE